MCVSLWVKSICEAERAESRQSKSIEDEFKADICGGQWQRSAKQIEKSQKKNSIKRLSNDIRATTSCTDSRNIGQGDRTRHSQRARQQSSSPEQKPARHNNNILIRLAPITITSNEHLAAPLAWHERTAHTHTHEIEANLSGQANTNHFSKASNASTIYRVVG